MSDATSLTIVRVIKDLLLPKFYAVYFNKPIDATEAPYNLYWLQASDELDAVRQVHEMVANGEIKEVTV